MVTRAFRKAGLPNPVRVLRDGDAAVAYLAGDGEYADRAAHPLPAFVLLDLKLPRRSGLEVLAWLKGRPGLRRLPVAVLTASRESPDVARAYDLGANSYLVKPAEPGPLLDMVRTLGAYWAGINEPPETDPP
jgi:CheY-like chemotaxis protein